MENYNDNVLTKPSVSSRNVITNANQVCCYTQDSKFISTISDIKLLSLYQKSYVSTIFPSP